MKENTQETNLEQDTDTHIFRIEGRYYKDNCLPSLNDLLGQAERHPQAYNRLKRSMEQVVIASIRRDLCGYKPSKRISLDIVWGEKNKGVKRDFDNVVSAGRKIINDALVKSGTIKDDNPNYLMYGRNKFTYVSEPYIEVRIIEETS